MLRRLGESLAVGSALLLASVSLPAQTSPTAATPASKSASGTPGSKPATPPAHKTGTSQKTATRHRKSRKTTANWKKHGQQKIDPQRASEIQEALIREHYLAGNATGVWDDATQKAMQRYQSDNGWQAKSTPDARALIKLGLGPDQQHLLNPDSAMTGNSRGETLRPASPPAADPGAGEDPPEDPPRK